MQTIVQDIDNRGGVSSLPRHGECLERREEATDLSSGTTRVVSTSYPTGDPSSSRNHQWLSKSSWHHGVAAWGMVPRRATKTGHASDHRLGKTGHRGDHRVDVCVEPQHQPRKLS